MQIWFFQPAVRGIKPKTTEWEAQMIPLSSTVPNQSWDDVEQKVKDAYPKGSCLSKVVDKQVHNYQDLYRLGWIFAFFIIVVRAIDVY